MLNKKFIHIFDDDKFVDVTIELFETTIPQESIYYVNKVNSNFKYLKSKLVSNVILNTEKKILQFANKLNLNNKIIIIHALDGTKQSLINKLSNNHVIAWFIWGYGLYSNFKIIEKNIYEPITFRFINRNKSKIEILVEYFLLNNFFSKRYDLLNLITRIHDNRITRTIKKLYPINYYRAINKLDFIVPVVKTEMKLLKTLNIKPRFSPYTYGYVEQLIKGIENNNLQQKKNILVGNSATASNNHLEVLEKLSFINLENRDIVLPLSYGDTGDYLELIKRKSEFYFGDKFQPILDFKPLEEYNNIIKECGIAIFNHIRQQAVGNIISTCYLGAKVFLNNKSPVYEHFKKIGLIIFSTNELNSLEINKRLTDEEIFINKQILMNNYGKKAVLKKVETSVTLFNTALKEKNNVGY